MNGVVKMGLIGLGNRAEMLLRDVLLKRPDIQITAVCDTYEDRVQRAREKVEQAQGHTPFTTTNYHELIAHKDVDAVFILSAWETHVPMAVDCMEAGKYVALEVSGAYSIEDCWRLIRTYEATGTSCMFMENCCYGRNELMVLNMVQQGVLGDIVHCSGGYHHDLREEIAFGAENRHYRLRNYLSRNCENYPTHELGPIARVLDINRGNRMVSLTSVSSCAKGLHAYIKQTETANQELLSQPVQQGDVVTTIICCARGETIALTLDTTLPRAYSRGFTVRGTKGLYQEDNHSVFLDGQHNRFDFNWREQWGNADSYREQYEHPIWQKYLKEGVQEGHDGMDWLVIGDFLHCVLTKTPPPIDVYDAAAWMSITALSEQSIQTGAAVPIPDFTSGRWLSAK